MRLALLALSVALLACGQVSCNASSSLVACPVSGRISDRCPDFGQKPDKERWLRIAVKKAFLDGE
jgi:hypothetical protein